MLFLRFKLMRGVRIGALDDQASELRASNRPDTSTSFSFYLRRMNCD
jgi:hypothetical protein